MRLPHSPVVPLVLCVAALLACKQGADDSDSPSGAESSQKAAQAKQKATEAEAGAKITTIEPGEVKPGPVYLAVKDTGVVMMDGARATTVQPLRFSVQDMVHGSDGAVWVSASSGVYRIQGAESREIAKSGGFQGIAVVSEKDVYAVNYKGLHHYQNGSWTVLEKEKVGATLLRDVEVDADGNVWVVSSNALHTAKPGSTEWSQVDVSSQVPGKPFFKHLARGPDKTLYATMNRGLLKLEGGQWKKVSGSFDIMGTDAIDISPTGVVAALGGTRNLYVVGPEGTTKVEAFASLQVRSFKALAIDGSNRVWLATDNGLLVVDEKGNEIEHWPPATLEGVAGDITHLVVAGSGPIRLPKPTPQATGTVNGKVLKAGSPTPGAEVEICGSPSLMFKTTPCEDKPFRKTTRTSPAGEFSIADVPIGSYGFAVKTPGEKWMITLGSDCCTKMKQGQEYDVGAIKLK